MHTGAVRICDCCYAYSGDLLCVEACSYDSYGTSSAVLEDSVKYGHLHLRNIPVTHNKSPMRWRNVRPLLTVLTHVPGTSSAGHLGNLVGS